MAINDATHRPRLRGREKKKSFWNKQESRAMSEALLDLAFDPTWRSNCGFKNGYMVELHRRILINMPTFSKQVNPHIDSKLKSLKKKYHAIKEMCKQRGCSWNYAKQKVQCEKQWYENWVETHKDAKGLWDVTFPYLEAFEVVYGRGRGNRNKAIGCEDVVLHLKTEETPEAIDLEDDDGEDGEDPETQATGMNSRKQKKLTWVGRNAGAERAKETTPPLATESQFEAFNKQFGVLTECLASIASTMQNKDNREQLRENKANTVVKELMKLGLPDGDMFRAADMLSADYSKLNVFSQLSLDQKRHYVVEMLYPSSSYHATRSAR